MKVWFVILALAAAPFQSGRSAPDLKWPKPAVEVVAEIYASVLIGVADRFMRKHPVFVYASTTFIHIAVYGAIVMIKREQAQLRMLIPEPSENPPAKR